MKTNDLRHTIRTGSMDISIRLNDECHNGHQDFSITATIWEPGKPHIDKYCIGGGCCHDEIVKARPKLKIFVNLHLCDWEGVPMYAVENGFYHITEGFNKTKPGSAEFKAEFCECYRVTPEQFDALDDCKNKLQYALKLQSLGILAQWKKEAEEGIRLLEEMTGNEFVPDSERSQFNAPTPEELKEEEERQRAGYYTPEAEAQREAERSRKEFEKLDQERDAEIEKIKQEHAAKAQVLTHGGTRALNNCIFYNHTKEISFNWRGYGDQLTPGEIDDLSKKMILPEGVTISTKKK